MATTETNLWRAVRREEFPDGPIINEKAVPGVLHPTFTPFPYKVKIGKREETRIRPADVTLRLVGGATHVEAGGGTSLFDKGGVFGPAHWHYFKIPKGTVIPDSLRVIFTDHNARYDADHYQIEVRTGSMRIDAFKGALDNLARNAIVRAVQVGERA